MYSVTNEAFLQANFGPDWLDVYVTGFAGDPQSGGDWRGNRWKDHPNTAAFPDQNAYYGISLFEDDATGRARRTKDTFRATYVIVIDDVGTKVDPAKLPAALGVPTYKLETSPGNFQFGYKLEVPETDAGRVSALLRGIIKALSPDGKDPGMGNVTRNMRLPQGRNMKNGGNFACVLHEWAPDRCVKIEDVAACFGITLPAPGTGTVKTRPVVRPEDDELFGYLDGWGLIQGGRTGDGGYHCTCPWVDEHTGRADTGAAYYPGGYLVCHHGHCENRAHRELDDWVDARLQAESGGLVRTRAWTFPDVPNYQPPPAKLPTIAPVNVQAPIAGTGTPRTFFAELIYVASEDRYYSLATGNLLAARAVDVVWTRELTGVLPVTNARTGELMPASKWFSHPDNRAKARVADQLTYWPGAGRYFEDGGAHYVNRWVPPERVGLPVTDGDVAEWLRLVAHVAGREGLDAVERLLDWMALVVGAPGLKPGWHVIVSGGQGLGKDLIAQPMRAGVGAANYGTVNAKGLHSQFNAWAERRLVIVNELKRTTSGTETGTDQYNTLKELTENTNSLIKINQKNMREYYARNVGAYYVTSNEERAVALEADDRRFMVIMAGDAKLTAPWPEAAFKALREWMDAGGAELCAEWLHDRWEAMPQDRRDALTGRAPMTAGKVAMIAGSEDPVTAWVREQIATGAWPDLMTTTEIETALAAAARSGVGGFRYTPPPQRWGAVLRGLGGAKVYGGEPVRMKGGVKPERVRMWATRAPERFDGMGEPQLVTAHRSAAGHAFADEDSGDVTHLSPTKDAVTDCHTTKTGSVTE